MNRGRSSVMFVGFAAMATVACPLAAGCMADESDGMVSDDGSDVEVAALALTGDPEDPPTGHNPFYPMCFWNHGTQQTYRDLAGSALANAQGQLPNMPYMGMGLNFLNQITCREQSLRYLIQCALPQGTSVTDPANNVTYDGHYGIAPEWRTGALSSANKEWMTSCLTQHLNGYATSTALLLEGNRTGFTINTVPTGYPYYDSITWGNLFTSTTPLDPAGWNTHSRAAFTINVCNFDDLDINCTSAVDALDVKVCSSFDETCGMTYRGNCETACTWKNAFGFPSPYWKCDGKSTSFRERLPTLDMYGSTCDLPE